MALFGTSGIRRVADFSLVELALKTGLAMGKTYPSVIVGYDTRTSSDAVTHSFIAGVLTAGAEICDAGLVPTPTLALAAKRFLAGAMITASHNPPEYNGIKLWNPDGSAFDERQQQEIEAVVLNGPLTAAPWDKLSRCASCGDAIEEHTSHIMESVPRLPGLKVVLDCGGGAACVITPGLLKRLGCSVIPLNCTPSGAFTRPSEPTEANLTGLMQAVREHNADVGIAHDGDADRMMAVDDKGRFIPGDKLLVLFARRENAGEVVTTTDASMVVDELGLKVTRTRVGDSFVSDQLKKSGDFGGEPSGAWIFPGNSLCPDGIYAAARIAQIASGDRLSSLVDAIPSYPILRGSVPADGFAAPDLAKHLLAMDPVSIDDVDGKKLIFKDGWLLIRPSGTEPRVRVTAEAKNGARARELFEMGVSAVKRCIQSKREE